MAFDLFSYLLGSTASGGGSSGNIGYKVTFKVDGEDYYIASCQQGESITEPPTPTGTGTFTAWQVNGVEVTFPYTPSANVELNALFIQVESSITFNSEEAIYHKEGRVYGNKNFILNLALSDVYTGVLPVRGSPSISTATHNGQQYTTYNAYNTSYTMATPSSILYQVAVIDNVIFNIETEEIEYNKGTCVWIAYGIEEPFNFTLSKQ